MAAEKHLLEIQNEGFDGLSAAATGNETALLLYIVIKAKYCSFRVGLGAIKGSQFKFKWRTFCFDSLSVLK